MSFDWKVKTKANADSIELKSFEFEILREKLSNYTAYFQEKYFLEYEKSKKFHFQRKNKKDVI